MSATKQIITFPTWPIFGNGDGGDNNSLVGFPLILLSMCNYAGLLLISVLTNNTITTYNNNSIAIMLAEVGTTNNVTGAVTMERQPLQAIFLIQSTAFVMVTYSMNGGSG